MEELKASDALIDALGSDGRKTRTRKLTEDAMSACGELADLFRAQEKALACVLHCGRQPTRCPVCALAAARSARGLRPSRFIYATDF